MSSVVVCRNYLVDLLCTGEEYLSIRTHNAEDNVVEPMHELLWYNDYRKELRKNKKTLL
jgi:hypothetical protein